MIRTLLACLLVSTPGIVSADVLSLGPVTEAPDTSRLVAIHFVNDNQIVGLQFDLEYPPELVATSGASTETSSGHQVVTNLIDGGRRVIVFSSANSELSSEIIVTIPIVTVAPEVRDLPVLKITNIRLANKFGNTFLALSGYHPIDSWKRRNFSDSEQMEPLISGDSADPDFDGIPNLFELFLGLNPVVAESDWILEEVMTPEILSGERPSLLRLSYPAYRDTDGLLVRGESSRDLIDWAGIDQIPVIIAGEYRGLDGYDTFAFEVELDTGPHYYRLVLDRDPDASPVVEVSE